MGEAFTLNELTIMEIMGKGEEVKAKKRKTLDVRACARGQVGRASGKKDVEKR